VLKGPFPGSPWTIETRVTSLAHSSGCGAGIRVVAGVYSVLAQDSGPVGSRLRTFIVGDSWRGAEH